MQAKGQRKESINKLLHRSDYVAVAAANYMKIGCLFMKISTIHNFPLAGRTKWSPLSQPLASQYGTGALSHCSKTGVILLVERWSRPVLQVPMYSTNRLNMKGRIKKLNTSVNQMTSRGVWQLYGEGE